VAETETVSFSSPRGRLTYQDSRDHFENGLLRLLHLDRREFEAWLATAEAGENVESLPDLVAALGRAFQRLRPLPSPSPAVAATATAPAASVEPGPDGEIGAIWQARIAESPAFGVARAADGGLGWLVKRSPDGSWQREREPPAYEEAYFEGDPLRAGGYGDYAAQQGWRLDKARRQLREIQDLALAPRGLALAPGARALDVGSGYGFFRKALAEAQMTHDGLEISAHARAVASRLYGFETAGGTLAQHLADWQGRYDLITLWDMLEHVEAPRAFLAEIASCLRPGGLLAIKTPNLDCPEAEIFGPHYHSLKREHLVYFAGSGLEGAGRAAGLETVHVSSSSHLLVGFVGRAQTERWAAGLRGADLTIYLRRPAQAMGAPPSLRHEKERV
jgi:SAM-dependent methyltransferase